MLVGAGGKDSCSEDSADDPPTPPHFMPRQMFASRHAHASLVKYLAAEARPHATDLAGHCRRGPKTKAPSRTAQRAEEQRSVVPRERERAPCNLVAQVGWKRGRSALAPAQPEAASPPRTRLVRPPVAPTDTPCTQPEERRIVSLAGSPRERLGAAPGSRPSPRPPPTGCFLGQSLKATTRCSLDKGFAFVGPRWLISELGSLMQALMAAWSLCRTVQTALSYRPRLRSDSGHRRRPAGAEPSANAWQLRSSAKRSSNAPFVSAAARRPNWVTNPGAWSAFGRLPASFPWLCSSGQRSAGTGCRQPFQKSVAVPRRGRIERKQAARELPIQNRIVCSGVDEGYRVVAVDGIAALRFPGGAKGKGFLNGTYVEERPGVVGTVSEILAAKLESKTANDEGQRRFLGVWHVDRSRRLEGSMDFFTNDLGNQERGQAFDSRKQLLELLPNDVADDLEDVRLFVSSVCSTVASRIFFDPPNEDPQLLRFMSFGISSAAESKHVLDEADDALVGALNSCLKQLLSEFSSLLARKRELILARFPGVDPRLVALIPERQAMAPGGNLCGIDTIGDSREIDGTLRLEQKALAAEASIDKADSFLHHQLSRGSGPWQSAKAVD
ncbi:hypothetical protein HPB47_028179, partial [Ixodes persulcatus]